MPLPEASRPKLLFQTPLTTPQLDLAEYVASRDGQRFLVSVPQSFTPAITVVLDWRTTLAKGGG